MSFSPMTIEEIRSRAQDFTLPYHYEYTTIAYKKPDVTGKMYIYFQPFKLSVSKDTTFSLKKYMTKTILFNSV